MNAPGCNKWKRIWFILYSDEKTNIEVTKTSGKEVSLCQNPSLDILKNYSLLATQMQPYSILLISFY